MFYGTHNNFGPLNDHIITELSCFVIIAPAVPKRIELSYRDNLKQPVECKTVRTENNYETNPPVEFAQCLCKVSLQRVYDLETTTLGVI